MSKKTINVAIEPKHISMLDRLVNHYNLETTNSLSDKNRVVIETIFRAFKEEQKEIELLEKHMKNNH